MRKTIFISCLTLVYSNIALGVIPEGGEDFLAEFGFDKNPLTLTIDDQAKDGCMPYPQRVKDAYEAELRRVGFKIEDPEAAGGHHFFEIQILSSQAGNLEVCYFSFSVSLRVATWATDTELTEEHWIAPRIWYYHGTGVRNKANLQQYFEDGARGAVNDLFLAISRAHD